MYPDDRVGAGGGEPDVRAPRALGVRGQGEGQPGDELLRETRGNVCAAVSAPVPAGGRIMPQSLEDRIAQVIFENHEEQCCTCGEWKGHVDDREEWLKIARLVIQAYRNKP